MCEIAYGKILTYGDISDRLNSHARAVGMACGANPIPIIIPCHRVIGKNGKLTGFSGGEGIETKRYLLELEDTFDNLDDNLKFPF
jgi:methylated-DNA-[protein]-cysteine S-methyltransferase